MDDGLSWRAQLLGCRHFRQQLTKVYYEILGLAKCQSAELVDLVAVAKQLGLKLLVCPDLDSEGIIGSCREGGRVVLLKAHPTEKRPRSRFTLAHEIAHELVHREMLWPCDENGAFDKARLRSSEESFCDFIAGLILMPLPAFVPYVQNLAKEEQLIGEESLTSASEVFGVSRQALLMQLCLIRQLRFYREHFSVSYNRNSDLTIAIPHPKPPRYTVCWQFGSEFRRRGLLHDLREYVMEICRGAARKIIEKRKVIDQIAVPVPAGCLRLADMPMKLTIVIERLSNNDSSVIQHKVCIGCAYPDSAIGYI